MTSAPIAELRDAEVAYGERTVWSGLDLAIQPGQFVAVLGANGSGKTSLLRVLLGEQQLRRGRAEIAGRPVRRHSAPGPGPAHAPGDHEQAGQAVGGGG